MRYILFIVTTMVLASFFRVDAQEDPLIDINCPTWGTENRLPSNSMDTLLFKGQRSDGNRDVSLYLVDDVGISEVNLPAPVDGYTRDYSLSSDGTFVAYFAMTPSDESSVNVFNTYEETSIQFAVEFDVASKYKISWIDDLNVALTPTSILTGNEQLIINVDTATIETQIVSLPPEIELPFVVDYAPHLNLFAFLTPDDLGIAALSGNILFSSQTFDYYNSISSIAWGDDPNEVLLYTDDWYIFSVEGQELTAINAPTAYQLFHTGIWSLNDISIAFTGFRLPIDRPNILGELIVYDRATNKFTDFCQIGDFFIYGSRDMYWSTNSRYFAYILTDNRGRSLYVLDVEQSTVSNIKIEAVGEAPGILGWRSGDLP